MEASKPSYRDVKKRFIYACIRIIKVGIHSLSLSFLFCLKQIQLKAQQELLNGPCGESVCQLLFQK